LTDSTQNWKKLKGAGHEVSIKEAFLYERNRRWAGKIDDYFPKGLNSPTDCGDA